MPSALSYPGVYVEEIPSGVRTIVGVATSIAAFVGRTERGPIDTATTITSYGDFERTFGGLSANAPVAYAVRDFYLNGGGQAVVVRLLSAAVSTGATGKAAGIAVTANSPGQWAKDWVAALEPDGDLFTLTLQKPNPDDKDRPIVVESISALSVDPNHRRAAAKVVAAASGYITLAVDNGAVNPAAGTKITLAGGTANAALADPKRYTDGEKDKKGLFALEQTDLFNLLCIPPDTITGNTDKGVYAAAMAYCEKRRAMLIVDPPATWQSFESGRMTITDPRKARNDDLGLSGTSARNAALYFPRVVQADPAQDNREGLFAPCGIVAGIFAKTDATRGVWKAPAGQDAGILGIRRLGVKLTDPENGLLNPVGINCLRSFSASGNVIWGARTLRGDDQLADEYKYVPIRRLALFIEESLYRGTQWAVFEPNDEPLWAQLRLNIGSFMRDLFRQGAFQGLTPQQAYLVKCDKETTTQSDINKGIVNVLVGFAPLKPAEFVVLKIQQLAGQIDT